MGYPLPGELGAGFRRGTGGRSPGGLEYRGRFRAVRAEVISGNSTEPHLHIHAERDGLGLDLEFAGITGGLYRGRRIDV